jgi:hypothetical protein
MFITIVGAGAVGAGAETEAGSASCYGSGSGSATLVVCIHRIDKYVRHLPAQVWSDLPIVPETSIGRNRHY